MRIVLLFLLFFSLELPIFASWFTMSNKATPTPVSSNPTNDEIPILDSIDRLNLKRQKEAQQLIEEGKKIIASGEKKNDQRSIVKGKIKKEIGEKQLQFLKEQAENKKKEDAKDEW